MARRRKLNTRVATLVGALTALVVLVAIVFFATSKKEDPAKFLAAAEAAMDTEGGKAPNYQDAIENLQLAIQNAPPEQRPEIFLELAEVLFKRFENPIGRSRQERAQDIMGAREILQKEVLTYQPDNVEANELNEKILWTIILGGARPMNYLVQYVESAQKLQKLKPDDAELDYRIGFVRMNQVRTDPDMLPEAIRSFEQAVEKDPETLQYYMALASSLLRDDREAEADQVMRDAIANNPENPDAEANYGLYLAEQGRRQEAMEHIDKAIEIDPEHARAYMAKATILVTRRPAEETDREAELKEAEAALIKARQIDPTNWEIYNALGRVYRRTGDTEAAEQAFLNGLEALDEARKQRQEGAMTVDEMELARARLYFNLADLKTGQYFRLRLEEAGGPDEARMQQIAEEKTQVLEDARAYFEELDRYAPNSLDTYKIAGQLAFWEGDFEEAREKLEAYLSRNYDMRSIVMLVDACRELNMPGRSEEILRSYLKVPELMNDPTLRLSLARLLIMRGEFDEALDHVDLVLTFEPNNRRALRIRNEIRFAQGETDVMGDEEIGNRLIGVGLRRARDLMAENEYEQAEELLESLREQAPDSKSVLVMRIRLKFLQERRPEALQMLEEAREQYPDDEVFARLETLLRETDPEKLFEIQMGYADEMESELARVLRKRSICLRYGKTDQAQEYLQKAREIAPDNPVVITDLFNQALAEQQWESAEEVIDSLDEDDEDERAFQKLFRGQLKLRQAQAKMAEDQTEEGRELLGEAERHLRDALADKSHMVMARLLLGQTLIRQEKYAEAKEQYEIVHNNNKTNIQAIKMLARLALQEHDIKQFEEYIRLAYQQPAGKVDPMIRDAYLSLEVDEGDPQVAIEKREEILRREPGNVNNALALARLYEDVGSNSKAERIYTQLYNQAVEKQRVLPMLLGFYARTDQASKANELISQLLRRADSDDERIQVRIAYANFLAGIEKPDAAVNMFDAAIAIANETDPKDTRPLWAKARFYASRAADLAADGMATSSREAWRNAIETMEQVVSREEEEPLRARRVLNRYYVEVEDLERAAKGFRDILADNPDDATSHLGLGLVYLRQGKLDDARREYEEAIRLEPDSPEPYLYRAEYHAANGDLDAARRDIDEAVKVSGNIGHRGTLAKLYISAGRMDDAERVYREIYEEDPEQRDAYIGLVQVYRETNNWEEVGFWANKALQEFPDDPYFLLMLSDAYQQRGDTRRQLRTLEQAVTVDPDNVILVRQYLMLLMAEKQFDRLREVAARYVNRPKHSVGVRAILAAAMMRENPTSEEGARMLVDAFSEIPPGVSLDVEWMAGMISDVYGRETLVKFLPELRKVRPDDWRVGLIEGDTYMRLEDYENAEKAYRHALEQADNELALLTVQQSLTQLYERTRQYDNAIALYEQILETHPNNPMVLNNLAYLYLTRRNDPDRAIPLIKRALLLRPGDLNIVDTYAWALAQKGDYDEAEDQLSNALRNKGKDISPDVLYHMAYIYEKQDRLREARDYCRQALEMLQNDREHPLYSKLNDMLGRLD